MRFLFALSIGSTCEGFAVLPFYFSFFKYKHIFSKAQPELFLLLRLDFNALNMISRQICHCFAWEVFCVLGLLNVTSHLMVGKDGSKLVYTCCSRKGKGG